VASPAAHSRRLTSTVEVARAVAEWSVAAVAERKGKTARSVRAWGLAAALACGLSAASVAQARDYDRNDVAVRGLGVVLGVAPVDKTTGCKSCAQPVAGVLRGMAAQQRRHLYIGGEVMLGMLEDARPWLSGGALIGLETASSAQEKLRAYAEFIASLGYYDARLADILSFAVEAGLRYQVRDYVRPHMLVTLGVRGGSNLNRGFAMVHAGLLWTFD
jgi:hypothetical protein